MAEDLTIARELGQSMSQLFRVAGRAKARWASQTRGGEWSTFAVLAAVDEYGPLRSSALAETVHLDPSRVSRMTAHTVELGLVARQPDPADGRAAILTITDKGESVLEELRRQRDEHLARVVADWSETDRRSLAVLLHRLAGDLAASLHPAESSQPGSAPTDLDHHPLDHTKLDHPKLDRPQLDHTKLEHA